MALSSQMMRRVISAPRAALSFSSSSSRQAEAAEEYVAGADGKPLPSDHPFAYYPMFLHRHGKRDVIGYGFNGTNIYFDRLDFPMPAIRFREETPAITALRVKEKGDWSKLTHAEVKDLYRHTFCQTYAEMRAPSGRWKRILSIVLSLLAVSLWMQMFVYKYVYNHYPLTMTDPEHLQAQAQRHIDQGVGIVQGISSHWDYEKKQWKD